MGVLVAIFAFLTLFITSESEAQIYLTYKTKKITSCSNALRTMVYSKAMRANAVCRPKMYKSKSRSVRFALSRIDRWRKYAQEKWDEEHNDIYEIQDGKMKPGLEPTYSYDRAVVYMYQEWADTCAEFNAKLADSLIELGHLAPKCKENLAFTSIQRMWRDNIQVQKLYEDYSGGGHRMEFKSNERGIASTGENY